MPRNLNIAPFLTTLNLLIILLLQLHQAAIDLIILALGVILIFDFKSAPFRLNYTKGELVKAFLVRLVALYFDQLLYGKFLSPSIILL